MFFSKCLICIFFYRFRINLSLRFESMIFYRIKMLECGFIFYCFYLINVNGEY